ncbi:hypothetical protein SELMODRAFT_407499 [Selaginella moellendorffii]|uniref:HMA domain-containing protein n=1 Tax=Selaginella moellendorffii TaxID=88036 RepID=D8R5T5_SELML|nr:hypothetical protein SELMODRAFT_407499 [Selaginella moellendorffii]
MDEQEEQQDAEDALVLFPAPALADLVEARDDAGDGVVDVIAEVELHAVPWLSNWGRSSTGGHRTKQADLGGVSVPGLADRQQQKEIESVVPEDLEEALQERDFFQKIMTNLKNSVGDSLDVSSSKDAFHAAIPMRNFKRKTEWKAFHLTGNLASHVTRVVLKVDSCNKCKDKIMSQIYHGVSGVKKVEVKDPLYTFTGDFKVDDILKAIEKKRKCISVESVQEIKVEKPKPKPKDDCCCCCSCSCC